MRALPVRRLATTALCATLLLGTAGPALASQGDATRDEAPNASSAPAPDANTLLGQVQQLSGLGGVLTPVTDLLAALLKAKDNKLPAEDVKQRTEAVKKAIEAVAKPPVKAPADPAAAMPQAPAVPQLPTGGAERAAGAPLDPKGDAVAALQKAVDALVKATTAGDPKAVLAAVPPVISSLVDTVVATVTGGGLPKPNVPGLPKAPAAGLPQTPAADLPQTPAA
ncbi:hypothetical protein AB0N81_19615 [Streptomyces sp. NPDC093510]|uniref:hypothetical protein n=1 Tax=Streptomyces sp. NPDC093510 TaxID=3155199 RepID=UPI003442C320